MRFVTSVALLVLLVAAAGCDLLNPPDKGFFYLKNDGDKTLSILVSDNDKCVIGLHSSVATHTWRNYDLDDKVNGAWLCIEKQPFKVVDGKSYRVEGGQVMETEPPQY